MKLMLAAIVADDRKAVADLLKNDATLARQTTREERLYTRGISHWFYVGDTALHLAAAGYRIKLIPLLLEAGAEVNAAANRRKSTPLHYAADGSIVGPDWNEENQVKTLGLLLDAGADVHCRDGNGATPLHRAVRTRCAAATAFLLKAGADADAENNSGSTAFHLAVQNSGRGGSGAAGAVAAQKKIIETFLAAGADPKRKSGSGKSVADSARSAWIRELLGA
jgi:ankyrin repeat protein